MSTDLEHELRLAMAAHESDAPTVEHFHWSPPALPPTRLRVWVSVAAAAAVVVAVAVAAAVVWPHHSAAPTAAPTIQPRPTVGNPASTPHSTGPGTLAASSTVPPPTALSCPRTAHDGQWVPARPHGLRGSTRLTPNRTPSTAVICAYNARHAGVLSGSRLLTAGLGEIPASLAWLPPSLPGQRLACIGTAGGFQPGNYLIGLTYGSASIWISAPDECVGSSNGRFASLDNVDGLAQAAYTTGQWLPTTEPPCASTGRLGQEHAMVPGQPSTLTICPATGPAKTFHDGFQPLVAALNGLPTRTSNQSCKGPHAGRPFPLAFGYPTGPAVVVTVWPGCRPSLDNTSLQARDDSTILPLITGLLGH
jgi:hypothetical protein